MSAECGTVRARVRRRAELLSSGWSAMRQRAENVEASHPGWTVRPAARRLHRLGLDAVRDADDLSLIGPADEVEAEIARLEGCR